VNQLENCRPSIEGLKLSIMKYKYTLEDTMLSLSHHPIGYYIVLESASFSCICSTGFFTCTTNVTKYFLFCILMTVVGRCIVVGSTLTFESTGREFKLRQRLFFTSQCSSLQPREVLINVRDNSSLLALSHAISVHFSLKPYGKSCNTESVAVTDGEN